MFYREKRNKKITLSDLLQTLVTALPIVRAVHSLISQPALVTASFPRLHTSLLLSQQSSTLHRVLDNASCLPPGSHSYPTCLSLLNKCAFHRFPLVLVTFRYFPTYALGFITDSVLAEVSDFLLLHLDCILEGGLDSVFSQYLP